MSNLLKARSQIATSQTIVYATGTSMYGCKELSTVLVWRELRRVTTMFMRRRRRFMHKIGLRVVWLHLQWQQVQSGLKQVSLRRVH